MRITVKLLVILTTLGASLAFAKATPLRKPALFLEPERPYLVLKAPLNAPDTFTLMNMFNDATVYSLSMNGILNGSGTAVQVGPRLQAEGALKQVFRVLSLYDLYLGYELRNGTGSRTPVKGDFNFAIVPLFPDLASAYSDYELPGLPAIVESYSKFFRAITGSLVKNEPTDEAEYRKYVSQVRKAMTTALSGRYPEMANVKSTNPIDFADWLIRSYQPLYWGTYLKADGQNSVYNATLLFPQMGVFNLKKRQIEPVEIPYEMETEKAIINKITYGNPAGRGNVIRFHVAKDFKLNDKIKFDVTFGRVGSEDAPEISTLTEDSGRYEDLHHEDGLIIHGYPRLKMSGDKGEYVNRILNSFHLEIGIHRLAFELTRPNHDHSGQPSTPAALIQDMPPFSIKDGLRVDRDKSVFTFKVWADNSGPVDKYPNKGRKLKTAALNAGLTLDQRFAQQLLCKVPSAGVCSRTWKSYREFHEVLINWDRTIAQKVIGGEVANSLDEQIKEFDEDQIDRAMATSLERVMGFFHESLATVQATKNEICATRDCSALN